MNQFITIVSGLPRSGTSLMMKMLEASGMDILTDNIRKADVDNPKGYYELEKVKKLKDDSSWLKDAQGKVFKMISMLLYELPPDNAYKIIFMQRDMAEMLASQNKMLKRRNQKPGAKNDREMTEMFEKHLGKIYEWIESQKEIDVLYVNYNNIINDPLKESKRVIRFLDSGLAIDGMVSAVDPSLYRNRCVENSD